VKARFDRGIAARSRARLLNRNSAYAWEREWLFPSKRFSTPPGKRRAAQACPDGSEDHISECEMQLALGPAMSATRINKPASSRIFRHSMAAHLIESGVGS
jgi:site-specific recombinase XerD